jgi:Fic family protein
MNLKEFQAGILKQQFQYKSFSPSTINHSWVWDDPTINVLLEKATRSLSALETYSFFVPDVDLFIQMHIVKEANASSRIEGTKTEIDEALMEKEDVSPEKRDDWQEVHNYISAIHKAIEELAELPLSNRLLCNTHAILMRGVRGERKYPGEVRKSQNWIGGSTLSDAVFIPPHWNELPELMSDLEKFWHNEEIEVPHLIRIAISHYQFETIHPFCDGNGRIGRLLIPLYFIGKGLLNKPSLYISDFFEKNRSSYYDAFDKVRHSNDLTQWVKFFLNAVISTSDKGVETFQKILALKNSVDNKILVLNKKAKNASKLLTLLYKQPIVTSVMVVKNIGVAPNTAIDLLNNLVRINILTEITGYKKNRKYAFIEYIGIFRAY